MSSGEPLDYRNLLSNNTFTEKSICFACGKDINPYLGSAYCEECREKEGNTNYFISINKTNYSKTWHECLRRLTKPEYLCYLALAAASRAEDNFTRVGGVIVNKDWRVLNTACNGYKAKMEIPGRFLLNENRNEKNEHIIHCEQNLFNFYHDKPYAIGLTISPCSACADTIKSHGIQEVYYIQEYWRDKELKFKKKFDFYSIKYTQMTKQNIQNILDFMEEDSKMLKGLLI